MIKVFSGGCDGNASSFIELPNFYVFGGVLHTKDTLEPVAGSYFTLPVVNNQFPVHNMMYGNSWMSSKYKHQNNTTTNQAKNKQSTLPYLHDTTNSDYVYILTNANDLRSGSFMFNASYISTVFESMYAITKVNVKTCKPEWSTSTTYTTGKTTVDIGLGRSVVMFTQTPSHIYCIGTYYQFTYTSEKSGILKIDKQTGEVTVVQAQSFSSMYGVIHVDGPFVYVRGLSSSPQRDYVWKIDTTTAESGLFQISIVSRSIYDSEVFKHNGLPQYYSNNYRYTAINSDAVTIYGEDGSAVNFGTSNRCVRAKDTEGNDVHYVWNASEVYKITNISDQSDTSNNIATRTYTRTPNGTCYYVDSKTVVEVGYKYLNVYKFDQSSESLYLDSKYEITNPNIEILMVMSDSNNNIWFIERDTTSEFWRHNIWLVTSGNVANVDVVFNGIPDVYGGVDVDCSLFVTTTKSNGQLTSNDVELTLKGNVYFADGTKTKTIQTSDTNITEIPIKVTGSGTVSCDAVVNVEVINNG